MIKSSRKLFSNVTKLNKVIGQMPWNFHSIYQHVEVEDMESPIDIQKQFLSNDEAVAIFKDFVDAI